MVEDLCFHLHDLVQNSAAAAAKNISVTITDSAAKDILCIAIEDDGQGMDRQTLDKVQDPFFTSKSFKKVGLGIPLLKATAQSCRGDFRISSRLGHGTKVKARLQKSNVDCPPLGNLAETMLSLLIGFDNINIRFIYRSQKGKFALATDDIRSQVGDLHFSHPEIQRFLKGYIHEGLDHLLATHS